ncbi:MAG: hypothetical protein QOH88_1800 [Verrucomicrobiota bacterium]|jgi:hypothetical protein
MAAIIPLMLITLDTIRQFFPWSTARRLRERLASLVFSLEPSLAIIFPRSIRFQNDAVYAFSQSTGSGLVQRGTLDSWIRELLVSTPESVRDESILDVSGVWETKAQTPYADMEEFARDSKLRSGETRDSVARLLDDQFKGAPYKILVRNWDKRIFYAQDGTHRFAAILRYTLEAGDDWTFTATPTTYRICENARKAILDKYSLWILGSNAARMINDVANASYSSPQVRTYDLRPNSSSCGNSGAISVIAVPRAHPSFVEIERCIKRACGSDFAALLKD